MNRPFPRLAALAAAGAALTLGACTYVEREVRTPPPQPAAAVVVPQQPAVVASPPPTVTVRPAY